MQGNKYAKQIAQEAKDLGAIRAHPVGSRYMRAVFECRADTDAFAELASAFWYVTKARALDFAALIQVRKAEINGG